MQDKRTEIRKMAKHIIAEEISTLVDTGGLGQEALETMAEEAGCYPATLQKEILRQAELLRKASI